MEFYERGVVFTCILLATLQLSVSPLPDSTSNTLNQASAIGTDLADTMKQLYESKSLVKVITLRFDEKEITELVGAAKKKVETMVSETKTELTDKDKDTSDLVAGAIGNTMTGLVEIVNGIRNSNWVQGVQGALSLVAAVANLAGPGLGTIATAVLSAVSTFLGLLGGSEPESQEGMFKRLVETVISEFRNKDLKEDVEGVQHVYDSLSTSIQQFRKSKTLSSSQADQLHTNVFRGLEVFGRMKSRVKDLCDKPNDVTKATNCIDFAKLYAELSILRQLIMTDLASLLSELDRKLKSETSESNLESSAQNILTLIRKEQENDRTTLAFLGSPYNHPRQRWAFALMFGNPEKFSTLISYLNALDETNNVGFWDDNLIICDDKILQGECVAYEKLMNGKHVPKDLLNIKSFFVPRFGVVDFWEKPSFQGKEFGPFNGPALYGNVGKDQYRSLRFKETADDNKVSIRFCEGESLNLETRCDYWNFPQISDDEMATDLSSYHGRDWVGKIKSFYLPPGYMLQAFSDKDDQYGPYFGPNSYNKICEPKKIKSKLWKTLLIQRNSADARSMIEFCDEEDLKGACFRETKSLEILTKINGHCDFTNKIKSIKVPAGYSVRGYKDENLKTLTAGPYIGPITIGKVDHADQWRSVEVRSETKFWLSTRASSEHPLTDSNFIFKYPQKKIDWKAFDRNETLGNEVKSFKNVHKELHQHG